MIELLEQLVSPSTGRSLLERILGYVVPLAQGLLAAIVTLRLTWIGMVGLTGDASLVPMWARVLSLLVKAVVVGWLLLNWNAMTGLALEESPRLAATVVGSTTTPAALAAKMVSLVAHFGEAGVLGLLDVLGSSTTEGNAPTQGESMFGLAGALAVLLAQIIAAAIAIMIAVPQLLVVVCLGIGPLAVAASIAETQLTAEFIEGWAETTASAVLTLPVMAILVVFIGAVPMPVPSLLPGTVSEGTEALARLASDLAVLLLIGQLTFAVLPLASGIIQGRPPGIRSFVSLVLAACLVPLRALRWAVRLRT